MRSQRSILPLVCAVSLAGCADGLGDPSLNLVSTGATAAPATGSVSRSKPAAYVLNEEEKLLDCRRLTGRMKIRILAVKDARSLGRSSDLALSLHKAQTNFGATATGSDPDGDMARDLAMIQAYNAQLAAKGCKTLDLEAELAPTPGVAQSNPAARTTQQK